MAEQIPVSTSDENLLAALSHFFGFLVALIVWLTQKDKSRFVRFQAVQAMAFDVATSIIILLVVSLLMLVVFGVLAIGVGDLAILGSRNYPTAEPIRLVIVLLTAVPFLFPCILVPLAGITFVARLIATIQTFQGKDFHYPWLGTWGNRSLAH